MSSPAVLPYAFALMRCYTKELKQLRHFVANSTGINSVGEPVVAGPPATRFGFPAWHGNPDTVATPSTAGTGSCGYRDSPDPIDFDVNQAFGAPATETSDASKNRFTEAADLPRQQESHHFIITLVHGTAQLCSVISASDLNVIAAELLDILVHYLVTESAGTAGITAILNAIEALVTCIRYHSIEAQRVLVVVFLCSKSFCLA